MAFLIENAATIVVCLILAALMGLAIFKMVKNRKKGGCSGCSACSVESCPSRKQGGCH